MDFIENDIFNILSGLPSECSYIDYKQVPYFKTKKHDFVKDVIAMLNSSESIGEKKYIIFGVTDDKQLIGIHKEQMLDDNAYQNWADSIVPRPNIQTGTLVYADKLFGYVCILDSNEYVVYEVRNTVCGDPKLKSVGKNVVLQGQAFIRQGSRNSVMMQADREQLYSLAEHRNNITQSNPVPVKEEVLLISVLAGTWKEDVLGDCKALEKLSGKDYCAFQSELRAYVSNNHDLFSFSNKMWKANNKIQMIHAVAVDIYDDHLNKLKELTLEVLSSTDPYLDYSDLKNSKSSQNPEYIYSSSFRHSLFEFWAFAGNNEDIFTSVSRGVIARSIEEIIESLTQSVDWKIWSTNSKELSLIAEASPNIFLHEIDKAIRKETVGLLQYINKGKDNSINQPHSLSNAIGLLAMYKEFFSKSGLTLLELGVYSNCFIDTLVLIMLPWLPLTEATKEARHGFLIAAFDDRPEIAWKLIVQLLPFSTTSSYNPFNPRYMKKAIIPENGVVTAEYRDEICKIVSLACKNAIGNSHRVIDLVPFMDVIEDNSRKEIITTIQDSINLFSEEEKYNVWLSLDDFIRKQKRHKGAHIYLKDDELSLLVNVTQSISSEIWLPKEKRLFRSNQWRLVEDPTNYEASRKAILLEQDTAAFQIYNMGEKAIMDFVDAIEEPKVFGNHLASVEVDDDFWRIIIDLLSSENIKHYDFAVGFIQSAYSRGNKYLQRYLVESAPENAIQLYELLPISADSILCSEKVDTTLQKHYWENVELYEVSSNKDISMEYVVNKLLAVKREKELIGVVFDSSEVHKKTVDPELIAFVLNSCCVEGFNRTQDYEISQLIKRVQDSEVNEELKIEIEWKYLYLLTDENGVFPKCIYTQFAGNTAKFMDVFQEYAGVDADGNRKSFNSEIYKLLNSWHIVPGTCKDGTFDGNFLSNWVSNVQRLADEKNIREDADSFIGRLLFYTPADRDGFFIDKSAAKVLNSDTRGYMRQSYLIESFNSRGAHVVDETGSQEFELEEKYNERAVIAENEGYTRFADTLRMIAQQYHDEAIYNIEETRKWRNSSD